MRSRGLQSRCDLAVSTNRTSLILCWTLTLLCIPGYVTHATDRSLWAFRRPMLEGDQVTIARAWLNVVAREVEALEQHGGAKHAVGQVLKLTKDKQIEWQQDILWDQHMRMVSALPGEQ